MPDAKVLEGKYVKDAPVGSLVEHPDNPRRGDVPLIVESIKANGFYGTLTVQKSTSYVLTGNHRLRAAIEAGIEAVPILVVDVDDATARRIMLADNRTSDLAYYDDPGLLGVLSSVPDLRGTGYDQASIDTLMGLVAVSAAESEGTEYGNVDVTRPVSEMLAGHEEADIRSVILHYEGSQFDVVVDNMKRLRLAYGLDTNSDVVARLAADAVEGLG